jgi:hypothetical protein
MKRLCLLVVLSAAGAYTAETPCSSSQADASQALLMMTLLASPNDASVDAVLSAAGTRLILEQQNQSRKVTDQQYREVMAAFAAGREPHLVADSGDAKSQKGVEGLERDVLPSLRWGAANLELLRTRLKTAHHLDLHKAASTLAEDNLPAREEMAPCLFLVMGGRAGAAASEHGLYFDVLASSFKAAQGGPAYPSDAEIVEYFAHEVHHVALERIIRRRWSRLRFRPHERRAADFLRSVVLEGSASYLINGHRNLAAMRGNPMFGLEEDNSRILADFEQTLQRLLDPATSAAGAEAAVARFAGNRYHAAGSLMMDAIYQADGMRGARSVMADPRSLLVRYRKAATRSGHAAVWVPEKSLAQRVSRLGEH